MNRILVICAHPDDETLGLGGTICHHVEKGDKVNVLIFTDGESARGKSNSKIKIRQKQSRKAAKDLGVEKIKFLNYPDQQLDIIAIKDLAKKIESEIKILNPNIIYTHYWGDVNQDHKKLFDAGSPFGHRIHKDKSKQTPRKHKYKGIDINVEED